MSEKKPVNLNRTIWISLFTSVFYLAAAVIETPTATSNNAPKQDLAQSDREARRWRDRETTTAKPSNTEGNATKKPVSEAESAPVENSLEKEIIAELNRARTNPQAYADWLETQKQYYQGMLLKLPGEQPIRTNRGLRSLEEAITFLRQQNQLPALSLSAKLTNTAKQQITAISNNQTINSENNLVYNKLTPEAIVMQLVVDDGFPDRPHRLAIFDRNYQNAGIACNKIPVYDNVCAIAYTDETTATTPSATEQSETKPETSTTENSDRASAALRDRLPTPPNISTPAIPKPEVTTSPTATEEEVIVNSESSSNTGEETTETEANPTVESSTPETETETNPTVESSTPETETEATPTVESSTPETETEATPTVESDTPETEAETTPTVESNTPETEAETATNSETNNPSEAVEIVEAGVLQEGDETIPNDGSFYDSFPLEGSAGDSFTITLESSDFDTFLAIMDRDGNIIEQNDDINEEDSNSVLEITLPDNGTYSVIVNAYDKGGKGNYVLKVSR